MFKISWSDGLAIAGVVLTLILVVLDKAGKLKGSMLLVLLCVAGVLTLPLMLNIVWVSDAQGLARFSRGLLMCFVVGVIYSLIAVWVSPNNIVRQDKSETPPATTPPDLGKTIAQALKDASEPERADIITTLIIDSVQPDTSRYHFEVTNGPLPVVITEITMQTPSFMQRQEGSYVPKNLRPGEKLSIEGDPTGKAFPLDKQTNLALRIAYNAEVKGTRKAFVSKYRFWLTPPLQPQTILPFSVSHDDDEQGADPRAEIIERFELPEATVFFVLPEKQPDGTANIVTWANNQRRFLFDPTTKRIVFETRAQSGLVMGLQKRLPDQEKGLHVITLMWSSSEALLSVDGVQVRTHDSPPKG